MGDKQRRKIWVLLYVLTAIACLVNYLLLPETVVSGVRVANGVRSLMYSAKEETIFPLMVSPLAGLFLWNTRVKKLDQKIAEHPNLISYKLRRFWSVVAAWLFSALGLIVSIAVLALNV